MIDCPVCKHDLTLTRLKCDGCGVVLEGNFNLPRLARLDLQNRNLAEQMILAGGNLKDLAVLVGVSYPTLRKLVDELISAMHELKKKDEQEIENILKAVESGVLSAGDGVRKIREIQGEI